MKSILKVRFLKKPRIFITYRRAENEAHAGRLRADLSSVFPDNNIFFDIDSLEGGDNVFEQIVQTINTCDVLLVLIGRNWLTCQKDNKRRLDDPKDWVRREIAIGLRRGILVIPVLVQGATVPPEQDLPEDLEALAGRNAIELSERRWDDDIDELINRLKRLAPSPKSIAVSIIPPQKILLPVIGSIAVVLAIWGATKLWRTSSSHNTNNIATEPLTSNSQTTNLSVQGASSSNPTLSELKIFFGNLHAHSAYSDGSGTPDEAYQYASNQGGLSFLAITDHNHDNSESGLRSEVGDELADRLKDGLMIATDPNLYRKTIQDAIKNTQDDKFVALYGQEYSTVSSGNHINVYSANSVIDIPNGAFATLYGSWLPKHPEVPFIQFNHPRQVLSEAKQYGLDDYSGSYENLRTAVAPFLTLLEVISGPAFLTGTERAKLDGESAYRYYLTRGFRIAPTGGQDNHFRTWGTATDARTGVLAKRLTGPDLIEALKSRRCYATTDKNLKVWFTVNRAIMGSEIDAQRSEIRIDYIIDDDDDPHAEYEVNVVYGSPETPDSAVETVLSKGRGKHQEQKRFDIVSKTAFVYLKIRQTLGDAPPDYVLTSPVWIKVKN